LVAPFYAAMHAGVLLVFAQTYQFLIDVLVGQVESDGDWCNWIGLLKFLGA
jgi:hypothetical protein